jgi:hypothetical protein
MVCTDKSEFLSASSRIWTVLFASIASVLTVSLFYIIFPPFVDILCYFLKSIRSVRKFSHGHESPARQD